MKTCIGKKNNYFDHNVTFKVLSWKFAKSGQPFSLLFMTTICDIKTKDPFSIISRGEHLKGWKIFFFLWNSSLEKDYLAVKWKRPLLSGLHLQPEENNCPRKSQSTWNFHRNYWTPWPFIPWIACTKNFQMNNIWLCGSVRSKYYKNCTSNRKILSVII